ncbi:MAG: hypothetical protein ABJ327_02930 [Litoreibacter sp.]
MARASERTPAKRDDVLVAEVRICCVPNGHVYSPFVLEAGRLLADWICQIISGDQREAARHMGALGLGDMLALCDHVALIALFI